MKDVVTPTGEKPAGEAEREQASNIATLVETIRQNERADFDSEMAREIAKHLKPRREDALELTPSGYNRQGEPVHRVSLPIEPAYRRLSEEERAWRTPESDHFMKEWIVGNAQRNEARMLMAAAKLESLFPTPRHLRADLAEGTAGASGAFSTGTGGPLIPRPLEAVIMVARDRVAKARRFVTVIPMSTNVANVPTAASMTAAMTAEGTTSAQGEPTISQVQLVAMKCQAKAIASRELLDDSPMNVVSIIASRAGAAIGVVEDNEIFKVGTGVLPHVTSMLGTSYTVSTSAVILKYTDVVGMYFAVPQEYLDNAVWLVSSTVLQYLSNVRDGFGKPFYNGLLADSPRVIDDAPAQVGSILGRPAYRVPSTPGMIWFGDPKAQYILGDRQGIQMRVSEHIKFDLDQMMWLVTERFAGNNVDNSASQYALGITSANSL
jgi:HK97 family phage major capsid protein